jgi:hypothetical protein
VGLAADAQLNIKVDNDVLLKLKRFAHGHHLPYHRLARLWIYEGLRSEQAWAGLPKPSRKINMADLKVRERSALPKRVRSERPAHRRKPHSPPRA